ncbi:glutamine amidotransferase [Bartonella tamiae]|uniref:Putative glutamine amidotransferase domain-containing protein n=1 Tax=Bartonella tamiae Th239 TaxID=1094558 RepID=J0ZLC8_9HYPH|nr:glutamine amidotransferase [Bartonella tamiae]EJF89213.1 hypothetical protein ME5_01764 [Bartonella tamiae Th239]EJF95384.1 hypothetical protein MEG_00117 [Bartonella tamiae Th307]
MNQSLTFQPVLPFFWAFIIIGIAALFVFVALIIRKKGSFLRSLALVALGITLLNPIIIGQKTEPLESIVGVVIDRTPSQNYGTRTKDTDEALAELKAALKNYPQFHPRFIEVHGEADNNQAIETRLFSALNQEISDVPNALYAGTILITDGQVHDIPQNATSVFAQHPVNALITGQKDEFDREIKFVEPPRFGFTNQPTKFTLKIDEKGQFPPHNSVVTLSITVNGEHIRAINLNNQTNAEFSITLPKVGKNIIQASVSKIDGELTTENNETVAIVEGIKENLRVLLVSGEPYNGARIWRDLLKSDTSVDLVHFTILRPSTKSDNTPLNELSLIVFPTTELFVDKINDFDLVIFDRYQHYDVLPLLYYDYVAQYVKNGGALLMATGPEFSGNTSLARTPLISVLPALPTGEVIEKPYRPQLTQQGERHPVTRGLTDSGSSNREWGRWMRQIAIQNNGDSTVLMSGADDKPLMLLSHIGKGRVGMLLSDEGWLWARGFEGGGPYATLYRRLAHWLMKEQDLEEEALTANSKGQTLMIRRQTMADKADDVDIHYPSGKTITLPLTKEQEGVFVARLDTDETGLFEIKNGDKTTIAHVGPMNSPEFSELISTKEKLKPFVNETGGSISRLHESSKDHIDLPQIDVVKNDIKIQSNIQHTLRLHEAQQTRVVDSVQFSLFSGMTALLACIFLFMSMWYRESH